MHRFVVFHTEQRECRQAMRVPASDLHRAGRRGPHELSDHPNLLFMNLSRLRNCTFTAYVSLHELRKLRRWTSPLNERMRQEPIYAPTIHGLHREAGV